MLWTPAILVLDVEGKERFRIEGYLPREEFVAQLEMGLARVAFMHKQWTEAEKRYTAVAQQHPSSASAAEAMFWAAVSHYSGTKDHTPLTRVSQELAEKYPDDIWTEKASVWLPKVPQEKSA